MNCCSASAQAFSSSSAGEAAKGRMPDAQAYGTHNRHHKLFLTHEILALVLRDAVIFKGRVHITRYEPQPRVVARREEKLRVDSLDSDRPRSSPAAPVSWRTIHGFVAGRCNRFARCRWRSCFETFAPIAAWDPRRPVLMPTSAPARPAFGFFAPIKAMLAASNSASA